ncbi:MAG: hypothetical protein LBD11_00205 [Candidatus Peribacteria bacterium]|jgi:hypothetical protein|nr:hypothetical protein [Candidatus Peribacteria bacterium]
MLELYDFIDVSGNFPDAIVVFDAILRNEPREWGLRNTKNIAEWKNKLLDSSISSSERQKYINTAKQLYARHMLKSNP